MRIEVKKRGKRCSKTVKCPAVYYWHRYSSLAIAARKRRGAKKEKRVICADPSGVV